MDLNTSLKINGISNKKSISKKKMKNVFVVEQDTLKQKLFFPFFLLKQALFSKIQ